MSGNRPRTAWMLVAALACAAPASAAADEQPLGTGAWCWFADPRAITDGGRTYVGWVASDGDIEVTSYDHATGERVTAELHPQLERDDHANPALQIREDGRLVVYYSRHAGAELHYRVSARPGDVRAWEPPRTVPTNTAGSKGYTYPNPVHLAAEDRTYLFWRGGDFSPAFSTLADGATTWAPAARLVEGAGGRPYVKYAGDGEDTIHFAFTDAHPAEHDDVDIHYAAYRDGEILRADGSVVGPLGQPIDPAAADLVFDRPEQAWIHDVAVDPAGRPVLVFASFPALDDHRYHYARWTGTAWEVHEITAAGGSFHWGMQEPMYSGGLTLDHEDPSRVYLSRQDGDGWQVETWTTADGGMTWSSTPLTAGGKNVRPISPRGHATDGGDLGVLWLRGDYHTYTNYASRIVGLSEGATAPVADAEPAPRSGAVPLTVAFGGRADAGAGGAVTGWAWDFGDGDVGAGVQVEHVYDEPGRYFPSLTVTDAAGSHDTYVTEVVVEPRPADEPQGPAPPAATPTPPRQPEPAPSPSPGFTPAPEQAPGSPAAAARWVEVGRVRWGRRALRVRLTCASATTCRGRLSARLPRSRTTVARGRFALAPRQARETRVRLTAAGRARPRPAGVTLLLVVARGGPERALRVRRRVARPPSDSNRDPLHYK